MSTVAVINCSYYGMKASDRIYNLGAEKIANYHRRLGDNVYAGRWEPMLAHADKYYFSVIFTWDIKPMIEAVNLVLRWGKEVEIGGPAATFMSHYIAKHTGIYPHVGLDDRFEHEPGKYQMTFTSRGCPHGCQFCGVKRVEPVAMEYDDFELATRIGDNNIIATSWEHQLMAVEKLSTLGQRIDINSGFDVRFFEKKHYELYSVLNPPQWRFAFDSMDVWEDVWRVCKMMRAYGQDRHHVMFYCLVGYPGRAPEEALFRLDTIRELGMAPYPMRFVPLNSLTHKYVAKGWTEELLTKIQTYYQTPFIWKSTTFKDFVPGKNVVKVSPDQAALG